MDNYQFCAEYALAHKTGDAYTVLDYGCGAGRIVSLLRERGVNAFGCDVFYKGGARRNLVQPDLLDTVIKEMENYQIPFPSQTFDFVINNQVMEHVEDMDAALSEIHRVLKPGGKVLSLFPDQSIWREGHCGLPFLHWFQPKSKLRYYYAFALRSLGFGYHKRNKSVAQWSRHWCEYIDKWTWYRSYDEIMKLYSTYFSDIQHIEVTWLHKRLGEKHALNRLPGMVKSFLIHKYVGMVFICVYKQSSVEEEMHPHGH